MSDQSRYPSSPPSVSSGRPTPSIARPDWPWARNYSYRSRQGSPNPAIQGSNTHSGWDPRLSGSATSTQSGYSGSQLARATYVPKSQSSGSSSMAPSTGSTRQWSFTGFEWIVRDVHKLRNYVEGIGSPEVEQGGNLRGEAGDFEILSQSPMLGDHKFKLEIVPVTPEGVQTAPPTLSLYITTLSLDFADDDFEIYASMMVAIKCQDDRIGERGARPDWIWEFWQNDWAFRRDNEVWACPLPRLSKLLEHSRIQATDSLVVCVQIHSPVGPSIPQHPSVYHVPRDLLDGLEASLDNPNTGDVRFVCLEKYVPNQADALNTTASPSMLSSPSGPLTSHPTARKRIIYAHSDILVRRSEYFAAMLSSSFAENSAVASNGERKLYTVMVEEADFETIYWLLKYCYANWLLFKQNDDPRDAVEGVGAGWSVRWLSGQHDEWEWKPFNPEGTSEDGTSDNRSATSGDSVRVSSSVSGSASNLKKSEAYQQPGATSAASSALKVNSVKPTSTPRSNPPTTSAVPGSSSRAVGGTGATVRTGGPSSSASTGAATGTPRSQTISVPSTSSFPTLLPYPHSPHSKRSSVASPDPHTHPTPPPPPASALSIYQVAHRYIMPSLAALALEHILSTITPESSFALLLATVAWDELHSLVEDFVVDRWDEVCVAKGFEDCCKEIAAGEWGVDGGKTLMSVFRRLRSPAP